MVRQVYVPDRGHVIWMTFAEGWGHEQKGRRPALVISHRAYNSQSGLALVCPMTSHLKNYPFEVPLDVRHIRGAVLVDQIQSIDWRARKTQYAGRIPDELFREVHTKLRSLID